MSATAALTSSPPPTPRRYEVRRDAMVVEGHALADVELAGYLLGLPLGTAPVTIVVGGITASPFPFGDPPSGAEAWWPALQAPDLVDLGRTTVLCPCWPGNGSNRCCLIWQHARTCRPCVVCWWCLPVGPAWCAWTPEI